MARTTKNLNPSAAVRRDPAEEYTSASSQLHKRQDYTRFNVFVSEEAKPVWKDFQIYAKSIDMSVSELLNLFMAQTVESHAAEIEEAKKRFESARKHYEK